tara:strand:- start:2473 stop:4245 length:1773 start_codon:yes stop_codon:yes gene_type:complete
MTIFGIKATNLVKKYLFKITFILLNRLFLKFVSRRKMTQITRRNFLSLLSKKSLGTLAIPYILANCGNFNNLIAAPSKLNQNVLNDLKDFPIKSLQATASDNLELAEGLSYDVLIKWNDKISKRETFGYNNDFTCFIPIDDNPNDGILWVNHEYTNPLFVSGYDFYDYNMRRSIDQIDKEMKSVGGSILRVKKENDKWKFISDDKLNKRIDAKTRMKFNWDKPIKGTKYPIGTNSNCSGGVTPWGTILTCEENYDMFFGETLYDQNNRSTHENSPLDWEKFYNYPPEHYGWVVEVNPLTGECQKHVALGRFKHECCTLIKLEDERIVAYSGDDENNQFIYKFISSKPNSLKDGTLYVADTINGKWISLDYDSQPKLKEKFKDQTEVLIRVREAAKILGATPQNRPEDIEIDPLTGNIIIALTNNARKRDFHGSVLKIIEKNNKYDELSFSSEIMLTGGKESEFTCPDNLCFDLAGNLWLTSDMSGSLMNKRGPYYPKFKNNGVYVLLRHGVDAGKIIQVASAPYDAELTGPWFSPDYKTLFLSVQHPGEKSKSLKSLTSKWPHDDDGIPKPSVVTIQGKLLDKLNYLNQI